MKYTYKKIQLTVSVLSPGKNLETVKRGSMLLRNMKGEDHIAT
jgi:hypothetical protein